MAAIDQAAMDKRVQERREANKKKAAEKKAARAAKREANKAKADKKAKANAEKAKKGPVYKTDAGTGGGGGTGQFTETAANTIYNINSNGVILNGDSSSRTTTLQSGFTIQLAGATYGEENLTLASGKTLSAPLPVSFTL